DRFAVERRLPVKHILRLEPRIFPEKVPGAGSVWDGIAWVIPQLGQPPFDSVPGRHGREPCRGQPLLLLQPGVRLWSLRVFQPAIRIGDKRAVVVIDHRISAGRWIEELFWHWLWHICPPREVYAISVARFQRRSSRTTLHRTRNQRPLSLGYGPLS